MLSINNLDTIDLNKNVDENLIFESKLKKVKLILKKIDCVNVYETI